MAGERMKARTPTLMEQLDLAEKANERRRLRLQKLEVAQYRMKDRIRELEQENAKLVREIDHLQRVCAKAGISSIDGAKL